MGSSGRLLTLPESSSNTLSYIVLSGPHSGTLLCTERNEVLLDTNIALHNTIASDIEQEIPLEYQGPHPHPPIDFSSKEILIIAEQGHLHSALTALIWAKRRGMSVKLLHSAKTKRDIGFLDFLSEIQNSPDVDIILAVSSDDKNWTGPTGSLGKLMLETKIPPVVLLFTELNQKDIYLEMIPNECEVFLNTSELIKCGKGICMSCMYMGHQTCSEGTLTRIRKQR